MATKKKKTKKSAPKKTVKKATKKAAPKKKVAAKKKVSKKAAPKKKKVTAKKATKKAAPKKKAPVKKAPAKKAPAKKAPAKKAPAKKKAPVAAKPAVSAKPAAPKPAAPKPAAPKAAAPALKPSASSLVGSSVPTVTLHDQSGHEIDLGEQLLSRPWTVLYFYPKDDTPGCTKEACSFRDHMNTLLQDGVQVLGVSPDSPEDHRAFIEKYGLNFSLLSDPERKLIEHFKLWGPKQFMGREYMGVERTTFLLEGDEIVHAWQPVSVDGHVEAVLEKLGELRA